MMRWLFARAAFYPSILYNQILFRIVPGRSYWDVVDDTVVMGAMPLPQHAPQLFALGVRGVVNLCEEYEGPLAAYRARGLTQLHLPTIDFTAPSYEHVTRGVAFIREHAARGEKVYVHCKAGRGRSATLVLCWLMEHEEDRRRRSAASPRRPTTSGRVATVEAFGRAAVGPRDGPFVGHTASVDGDATRRARWRDRAPRAPTSGSARSSRDSRSHRSRRRGRRRRKAWRRPSSRRRWTRRRRCSRYRRPRPRWDPPSVMGPASLVGSPGDDQEARSSRGRGLLREVVRAVGVLGDDARLRLPLDGVVKSEVTSHSTSTSLSIDRMPPAHVPGAGFGRPA